MTYTIITDHGIPARDPDLPWDVNAPGLYQVSLTGAPAPESVVKLSTGERIAVSVEEDYREDGGSVCLRGYARWIKADGSSEETPDRRVVESALVVGVSQRQIAAEGLGTFRTEVLRLLLGAEPATRPINNPPGAEPLSDADQSAAFEALKASGKSPTAVFWYDPQATEQPLLAISAEQRLAADIRTSIALAKQLRAPADPAALLAPPGP